MIKFDTNNNHHIPIVKNNFFPSLNNYYTSNSSVATSGSTQTLQSSHVSLSLLLSDEAENNTNHDRYDTIGSEPLKRKTYAANGGSSSSTYVKRSASLDRNNLNRFKYLKSLNSKKSLATSSCDASATNSNEVLNKVGTTTDYLRKYFEDLSNQNDRENGKILINRSNNVSPASICFDNDKRSRDKRIANGGGSFRSKSNENRRTNERIIGDDFFQTKPSTILNNNKTLFNNTNIDSNNNNKNFDEKEDITSPTLQLHSYRIKNIEVHFDKPIESVPLIPQKTEKTNKIEEKPSSKTIINSTTNSDLNNNNNLTYNNNYTNYTYGLNINLNASFNNTNSNSSSHQYSLQNGGNHTGNHNGINQSSYKNKNEDLNRAPKMLLKKAKLIGDKPDKPEYYPTYNRNNNGNLRYNKSMRHINENNDSEEDDDDNDDDDDDDDDYDSSDSEISEIMRNGRDNLIPQKLTRQRRIIFYESSAANVDRSYKANLPYLPHKVNVKSSKKYSNYDNRIMTDNKKDNNLDLPLSTRRANADTLSVITEEDSDYAQLKSPSSNTNSLVEKKNENTNEKKQNNIIINNNDEQIKFKIECQLSKTKKSENLNINNNNDIENSKNKLNGVQTNNDNNNSNTNNINNTSSNGTTTDNNNNIKNTNNKCNNKIENIVKKLSNNVNNSNEDKQRQSKIVSPLIKSKMFLFEIKPLNNRDREKSAKQHQHQTIQDDSYDNRIFNATKRSSISLKHFNSNNNESNNDDNNNCCCANQIVNNITTINNNDVKKSNISNDINHSPLVIISEKSINNKKFTDTIKKLNNNNNNNNGMNNSKQLIINDENEKKAHVTIVVNKKHHHQATKTSLF